MTNNNPYIESEVLELKEKMNDNLTKEIVSFLNTLGGEIIIGVKDNGEEVGIENHDETLKKISDIIVSKIEPKPTNLVFPRLHKLKNGKVGVLIVIKKGTEEIYYDKQYGLSSKGCYKRLGSTCVPLTVQEINQRIHKSFADNDLIIRMGNENSNLTFSSLKIYYEEKNKHLNNNNFEKNLSLRNSLNQYNLLAELLADKNNLSLVFVKFNGIDKTFISQRVDVGNVCIITAYKNLINRLKSLNTNFLDTTVRPRIDIPLFDMDSVNEAILNAIIHNDWTIGTPQISFYSNRIEIVYHGGLISGLSEDEFFDGISRPINRSLMRVFIDLGLVEHTVRGVPKIVSVYGKESIKIGNSSIKCIIPFNINGNVQINQNFDENLINNNEENNKTNYFDESLLNLRNNERLILNYITNNSQITILKLSELTSLSTRTVERIISSLQTKSILIREGSKKKGKWVIKRLNYDKK